ncbi:hypothetical protein ACIA5E_18015 [Nocardia asteroides]|uniref:hypothetical protein n=1 Tax=Nocardia asteroides TaxID=1824 RepID=UPI00379DA640
MIERLTVAVPDIARQIREEVGRGTRDEDTEDYSPFGMYAKPSTPARSEYAPRKYTDDERIEILLGALISLTRTTEESRRKLVELLNPTTLQPGDNQRITFVDPVTDSDTMTATVAELAAASRLTETVAALIAAMDSIRPRG